MLTTDDFMQAKNLAELRRRYSEEGKNFLTARGFLKQAHNDWFELNRHKIIEAPDGLPKELPATVVEKDGIKYYIHGLIHAGRVEDVMFELCDKTLEGKLVASESLFNWNLDIDCYAMHDMAAFVLETFTYNLLTPFMYFVFGMRKAQASGKTISNAARHSIFFVLDKKYPKALLKHTARSNAAGLPVHLEFEYFSNHSSALWHNFVLGRSKYMAEFLRQLVHAKNADEVHAVVGLGHVSQIAYCIENDISSPRIEKLAEHYLKLELKSKGE